MTDVTLTVGGRHYTVACTDGQEDHVRELAKVIDGKLTQMGTNLSTNDAKNMLFAALMLAEQVEEMAALTPAQPAPDPQASVDIDRFASRLENIARGLENAATALESNGVHP